MYLTVVLLLLSLAESWCATASTKPEIEWLKNEPSSVLGRKKRWTFDAYRTRNRSRLLSFRNPAAMPSLASLSRRSPTRKKPSAPLNSRFVFVSKFSMISFIVSSSAYLVLLNFADWNPSLPCRNVYYLELTLQEVLSRLVDENRASKSPFLKLSFVSGADGSRK